MDTYQSHRKPKTETDRPVKASLKPYNQEHADGNAVQDNWLLFEDVDEGIVVLQNEKFCFTNTKMAEIADCSFDDLTSKKLDDFTHPEDRELVSNWYKRCLQGDSTNLTHPFRIITSRGDVKWVLGNSLKINWNGECAVMGFIADITPQKQSEDTSADFMNSIQAFFNHSRIGAFSFNFDGDILYANQVAADLLGYQSPEKMISENPMQNVQNAESMCEFSNTLKKTATVQQCNLKIKTKAGRSKLILCDGILHNDQVWILIHEAGECSPKNMEYQRELKARERLVNALDDGALLIDLDGRIQIINKTAADILGSHPGALFGKNIFSVMPSDSAIFKEYQVRKAKRLRKPVQFQTKFIDQHYEIRINPVIGRAGKINHMAIIAKNITKHVLNDKDMVKAQTQLKCEFIEQKKLLDDKTRLLDEANIALRVMLKKRDEDKIVLEQKIMNAVKDLVLPYVAKIDRRTTDDKCKTYIGILEANLKSILSPFSQKLSSIYMRLTPSEIEVAEYIKYGKSSKEIAEMLNLSVKTVETYRAKIRKKTGLRNKKTNLRTYLLSFKSL